MHPDPPLTIMIGDAGDDCCVVRLIGELDLATAPSLASALETTIRSTDAAEIVIEMTELRFLDASGITVLILARAQALRRGRRLRARHPHHQVETVLRLTGVADVLRVR